MHCFFLVALPLFLSSCNRDSALKLFGTSRDMLLRSSLSQGEESFANTCVELLRKGQYAQIEGFMDPSIKDADTRSTLAGMAEQFPVREPVSVKPVDVVHESGGQGETSITLQYEFSGATDTQGQRAPNSWILAQVVFRENGDSKAIDGLHVMQIPMPVESLNAFTIDDLSAARWAWLFLPISDSLSTLYVFLLCIRTRMRRGIKSLALLVILTGVSGITLNWTSATYSFSLLTIQIPPVLISCTPYGPWLIHITAPLGAIGFLFARKHLADDPPSNLIS